MSTIGDPGGDGERRGLLRLAALTANVQHCRQRNISHVSRVTFPSRQPAYSLAWPVRTIDMRPKLRCLGESPMLASTQKKTARLVARSGLLELRVEGGKVIRTLIYQRTLPASESLARALMTKEALTLGYTLARE